MCLNIVNAVEHWFREAFHCPVYEAELEKGIIAAFGKLIGTRVSGRAQLVDDVDPELRWEDAR